MTSGKTRRVFLALAMWLYFFMIFPYFKVAFFANPSADDFSNLYSTLHYSGQSFLEKAIRQSWHTYETWQGTYFGNFLTYAGGIIYYRFGLLGIHLEYVLNILLFYCALFSFSYVLSKKIFESSKSVYTLAFILASLISFMILYDFDVSEVFYWHTGLCMYTVPLSISLFVFAILIKRNVSNAYLLIGSVLSFIAAGGSLDISAFVCGVSLLLFLYRSRKINGVDKTIVVFLVGIIGAFFNVLSPGNYDRHDLITDQFPVWNAIQYSNAGVFRNLCTFVQNGTIVFFIILCILLFGKLRTSNILFVNPVLLMITLYAGLVIIDFPVYLGYAGDYFPLRCEFVRKVASTIFLCIVLINATGWIAKKTESCFVFSMEFISALIISLFLALHVCVPIGALDTVKPFKIYNDIYFNSIDHRLTNYEETNNMIISELQMEMDQDVVINVTSYDTLGYFKSLGLSSDSSNWVNVALASYFGNNSIVFNIN